MHAVDLHVHTVGLNFRDVLNVLGAYPGDPGPPGADCAGEVGALGSSEFHKVAVGDAAFGFSPGALQSFSRGPTAYLVPRPLALSPDAACTLSIVWSTVHVSFEVAGSRAGHVGLIHAASGGVGLNATEYAMWLRMKH